MNQPTRPFSFRSLFSRAPPGHGHPLSAQDLIHFDSRLAYLVLHRPDLLLEVGYEGGSVLSVDEGGSVYGANRGGVGRLRGR